jgi:hypothetical protein
MYEENSKSHTVLHFRPGKNKREAEIKQDVLAPYIREEKIHNNFGFKYKMKSVYNLPDFETLGYQSEILLRLVQSSGLEGVCLFWNPLQGHIPVIVHKMFSSKISRYILAGRDLLQLKISRANLVSAGVSADRIVVNHASFISDFKEPVRNHLILPDIIPMVNQFDLLLGDMVGSRIFVSDKSSNIFRLLENRMVFRICKKIKKNGFTGVFLERHV